MKFSPKIFPVLRQVLLYLLAILTPTVLILTSTLYSQTALKQEIVSSNKASVELMRTSLDASFQELRSILTITGNAPNLSRYHLLYDPATASNAIGDIISTHSMLDDMILCVRDADQFYSANGSFSTASLSQMRFMSDFTSAGGSAEDWLSQMQSATETTYWSGIEKSQSAYLYLFTPVYYLFQNDGAAATRTACMVIRQESIKNVFQSSQTSSDEGMLLLSPSGAPLSKLTGRTTEGFVSEVCDYIRSHPDIYEAGCAELPDSGLLVFASRSSQTGLGYVRFLPESIAYSPLQTQSSLCIAFVILAAVLGLILIATNTRQNYRPIAGLIHWIQGSPHTPIPENAGQALPPAEQPDSPAPPAPQPDPLSPLLEELFNSSCLNSDFAQLDSALSARKTEIALAILQRLRIAVKLCPDPEGASQIFADVSSAVQKYAPAFSPPEPFDPERVDSSFDTFAFQIQEVLSAPAKPEPLVQTDIGAQLLEYIDAHCLSYDFQLKNMAEHFAITPQYMRKLFKAHVGISLSEYVSGKRLEKATRLLLETDMPLQDIVSEIGNSDISGFVRFFKQKTGMTPGQFRKAKKEKETAQ